MKKSPCFFPLLMALFFIMAVENVSYGFSCTPPDSYELFNLNTPVISDLKASDFVNLTVHDMNILTGHKLTLAERLFFKVAKIRIKHDLKKNPRLKIADYLSAKSTAKSFSIGWFLFGFLSPFLGVITLNLAAFIFMTITPIVIAYVTRQDKVKRKSVWLGFASAILILTVIGLIALSSIGWY